MMAVERMEVYERYFISIYNCPGSETSSHLDMNCHLVIIEHERMQLMHLLTKRTNNLSFVRRSIAVV